MDRPIFKFPYMNDPNHIFDRDDDLDYDGHLASAAAQEAYSDPLTVRQALASTDRARWIEVMQTEVNTLVRKGTWTEATLPHGRKPISTKWVFKQKRDTNGSVVKFKARLVARGFSQVAGVDFEDTFAPVSRLSSLRIILAHAATHDLVLRQVDVEGAYLNGPLEEEIYISPPEGVDLQKQSSNCLRLNKALYGLKQSGRAWWLELDRALSTIGFSRCASEWGLHGRRSDGSIVLAYVDDLLIATRQSESADKIVAELQRRWAITDLGDPHQMLSLKIVRDRQSRTITLSSQAYIDQLGARFRLTDIKVGRPAPLPAGLSLTPPPEPTVTPTVRRNYQEMVGSCLWLSNTTRPDLTFASSVLSRVSHSPTDLAVDTARRVLGHALHTKSFGLTLGGQKTGLEVYCDSDFAGDVETRRSTSGFVAFLYGSPVSWSARRQGSVAASTTAAEYVAMAEAVREILFLRQLLDQLGMTDTIAGPTILHVDNLSAIKIGEKPVSFPLSKHIDVRYHLVREQVTRGIVRLEPIRTTKQLADIFTKALPGPAHSAGARSLNLRPDPLSVGDSSTL